MSDALPTVYAAQGGRYAGYSLRRVCNEMHDFYRDASIIDLQRLCFRASSFPELVISPKRAYEALVANEVDYVQGVYQEREGDRIRFYTYVVRE